MEIKVLGKGMGVRGKGENFLADCQMNCNRKRFPSSRKNSTVDR